MTNSIAQKFSKEIATIVLGVVIPLALMFQAYSVLQNLNLRFKDQNEKKSLAATYSEIRKQLSSGNDYLLFTKLHAERINLEVMANKQAMKIAIINIGFAVMSIGIMFILLGISDVGGSTKQENVSSITNEPDKSPSVQGTEPKTSLPEPTNTVNANSSQPTSGGLQLAGEAKGVKFDIKAGSTGLAVFLLGALMAAGGGLVPNQYITGHMPGYLLSGPTSQPNTENSLTDREKRLVINYEACKSNFSEIEKFTVCFTNDFVTDYPEVRSNEKK